MPRRQLKWEIPINGMIVFGADNNSNASLWMSKMIKSVPKIVFTTMVLVLLPAILGCSQVSSPESPDIVRGVELGGEWRMDQLIVNIESGNESLIMLRLDNGDKVDGYFYVEKGDGINFQIVGNSLIYESSGQDEEGSWKVTSDRFSFIASQTEGNSYTLTFRNPAESGQAKVTVFVEVIYPLGSSLFIPIERK